MNPSRSPLRKPGIALALTAVAGSALLLSSCSKLRDADDKKAPEPAQHSESEHSGNSMSLDKPAQERIGLQTVTPEKTELRPTLKAFGQVIDPSALATQAADYTTARAEAEASKADLQRITTLAGQNNASERSLQTATATAQRDAAQLNATRTKLLAGWGKAIVENNDLPSFVDALAKGEALLVRVDLLSD